MQNLKNIAKEKAENTAKLIFIQKEDTAPFLPHIKERHLIFFPIGGDQKHNAMLENKLFEAIAQASIEINSVGCYFIFAWNILDVNADEGRHFYLPTKDLKDALIFSNTSNKEVIWEKFGFVQDSLGYCLCSVEGDWGLMKTIDDYGFLGGSSKFIQTIKSHFPGVEKEVSDFLYDCKLCEMGGEEIDINWIKQLLNHIYGEETAKKLLEEAKLI